VHTYFIKYQYIVLQCPSSSVLCRDCFKTEVHSSVKNRYDGSTYNRTPIENYKESDQDEWTAIVG
jgi:hypothetical protein